MAKKQVAKALILGIVAAFSVTTATAQSIKGSPHDLSATWGNANTGWGTQNFKHGGFAYDDLNQICVYCHTPHNANTANGGQLLWNRPLSTATYTLYQSPTFNATMTQPDAQSSSSLCLSCHDGTIAVDNVLRRPVTSVGNSGQMHAKMADGAGNCGNCHTPGLVKPDGSEAPISRVVRGWLGTDLSNDHPVNMTYDNTLDTGLKPPATVASGGLKLFNGKVQCASCHDPHVYLEKAFLRKSNAGSALCTTCHAK